ncbi:excalibur calcium-binding protein, partial [Streptomyces vinaceusdrappus]
MRRRTGAAGIAVAIAAIVPLADPAHAQDPDSWTRTPVEAARSVSDSDPLGADPFAADPYAPGALSPDAYSPDALSPDAFG